MAKHAADYERYAAERGKSVGEKVKARKDQAEKRAADKVAKRATRAAEITTLLNDPANAAMAERYRWFSAAIHLAPEDRQFFSLRQKHENETDEDYVTDLRIERYEFYKHVEGRLFGTDASEEVVRKAAGKLLDQAKAMGQKAYVGDSYRPSIKFPKPTLEYLLAPWPSSVTGDNQRPIERILSKMPRVT